MDDADLVERETMICHECGAEVPAVDGAPGRFQRRQIARMTDKGHRVPGIPQKMGKRNHGLGVAGTPDKTEQDPHPTPLDALDNQATIVRALR